MASKKPDLRQSIQRIAQKPAQAEVAERAPAIDYPVSTRSDAPELPALAGGLSERMQEIARQYVGARRRSGEALLEAARWLSEARAEAEHGEWGTFLEATNTSDDAAERLLNIHRQAMQNPQFAEAIRTDWIGQSAAALLAQPSTPPEVVAEVLASPEPPTVAEVRKKVGQARHEPAQRSGGDLGGAKNPQFAEFDPATSSAFGMLREVALVLAHIERSVDELPAGAEVEGQLEAIERSLGAIRQLLRGRR